MKYQYITEDNLEYRQKYTYSDFGGKEFLSAYFDSRRNTLKELSLHVSDNVLTNEELFEMLQPPLTAYNNTANDSAIDMRIILLDELKKLQTKNHDSSLLDAVLKTFEVRKRLYHYYSENFKPLDETDYRDYNLYIAFAVIMSGNYDKTRNLKYLNSLLKCNDILISLYLKQEGLINRRFLAFVLNKELEYIQALCKENNIEL